MSVEIPSSLVEFALLGPTDDRRQLQDSPILGDVWVAFAKQPDACLDLLITPYMTKPAGAVASVIQDRYRILQIGRPRTIEGPNIAYLQGIVAARLFFEEVLRIVVPVTSWWHDKRIKDENGSPTGRHELEVYGNRDKTEAIIDFFIASAKAWHRKTRPPEPKGQWPRELTSLDRYVVLTGLLLWASDQSTGGKKAAGLSSHDKIDRILDKVTATAVTEKILELLNAVLADTKILEPERVKDAGVEGNQGRKIDPLVWQVSMNRTATPALAKSIPAVKADAAAHLFKVDTSGIAWAILDSGIDGKHPAFATKDRKSIRIKRSFDFREFRRIVSLSNASPGIRKRNLDEVLRLEGLKIRVLGDDDESRARAEKVCKEADEALRELAEDAKRGTASIHWDLVEKLVEIHPTTPPASSHGTHVAGIVGASQDAVEALPGAKKTNDVQDGMCPDINLYDFRVLGPALIDTEFAIIGVLQFIRYLNDRDNFFTIHGANLSLSIPHDVRNFACGRTPICNECERLVDSGVVVVAAAGNHGYKSFETKEGAYESYAAFSITDPGNADGVITVGATHRNWPHTYGVSFFSSRGPTGDGRLKPDLVAPGERIRAPLPDGKWGDLDGTSMAAPHVSGAAAMLMARYSELIGQPRRIKRILCDTATDLGRERSFQGRGMLDVLRAFQSI
jgi:serine protease AprX